MNLSLYARRLDPLILLLSTTVGGLVGVLVTSPLDLLFNIQAEIVGMIGGVLLGTLLFQRSNHAAIVAPIAGLGTVLALLIWPGIDQTIPEVVGGMALVAALGSGILAAIRGAWPR